MPALFGLDHKQLAIGLLGVTSGVAIYSTLKLLSERRKHQQQNVYESQKLLNEYLAFHYGSPREVLRYDFGPTDSVDFPKRCAELCWKHCKGKASSSVSSSLSLYTAWGSLSSIIGRCTLYTPGCRMKAYK